MEKNEKRKTIWQNEEDKDIWDPPILYKRPKDEDIKSMIRSYLEKKKLID